MACCGSSLSRYDSPISSPNYVRLGVRLPVLAASHVDPSYLPVLARPRIPARRLSRVYPGHPAKAAEMGFWSALVGIGTSLVGSIIGAVAGNNAQKEARKAAQEDFERQRQAALDAYSHELALYDEQQESFKQQSQAAERAREQGIQAGISVARYAVIGGAVLVAFLAVRTIWGKDKVKT